MTVNNRTSETTRRALEEAPSPGRLLIVGLGGDFGDDCLGWWIVDRLRDANVQQRSDGIRLVNASAPAEILGFIDGARELIVLDACQGLAQGGEIVRMRWPTADIATLRHRFGHNVPLPDVFELAASVGQLPEACEIWCVEGLDFQFGKPLSPSVRESAEQIVNEILLRLSV